MKTPAERPSIRLTGDDLWDALEAAHTAIFCTLTISGDPVMLPTWFVVNDRRIYMRTRANAAKVRRLQRNPRCSFLVEGGLRWSELRAISVCGTSRRIDTADPCFAEVIAQLDAKYVEFKTPLEDMPASAQRVYSAPIVLVEFEPDDQFITWDNRRLVYPRPGLLEADDTTAGAV